MSHRLSRLIPSLLVLVLLTGCFETGHANRAPVKEHDFVKATDSARDIPTDNPNNTEALASAGWSALFLEHHEDARANFKQLLDLASNDRQAAFDAMLGLAWINIKQNRFERAATLLDMAESRAQKWQRFMVLDARGWMAMGKDDTKAAKSFFEQEDSVIGFFQPLEDDPKVGLGWLAFNSGDYKEARVQFEEGLHRKSNCFYCRDGLAHIDLIENNPEQALDHVLEGLFVIRDHPNLSALLDRTLNIQTDPKISIKALERLVDHYPSHDIFRKRLTDALLAADKTDATAKTIEPIKNQDYYLDKASKLIRENAPDNARALLIQGEKTWPVSVKIKVMLVNAYIALDKPERALSKARAASRVDPVGADDTLIFSLFPVDMRQTLLFEQTWNLYYAGAYRSALIRFNDYVKAGGDNADAARVAGFALYRLGENIKAVGILLPVTALEPDTLQPVVETFLQPESGQRLSVRYSARSILGWANLDAGLTDGAESSFRAVIKDHPDWFDAWTGMGRVFLARKKPQEAMRMFRRALKLAPNYDQANAGLRESIAMAKSDDTNRL